MTFKVQGPGSVPPASTANAVRLISQKLEDEVRDPHMGFKDYRICHHSERACCRGFWNAHKDEFALGQVAQRLGMVEFVDEDVLK